MSLQTLLFYVTTNPFWNNRGQRQPKAQLINILQPSSSFANIDLKFSVFVSICF